jgi:lipopolysaccharide biosynthesis regulator YciM
LLAADVLGAAGRHEQARADLAALLKATERRRTKAHARWFVKLAELAIAEDDFGAAYEPLQQAHQLDKSDADAAFLLGMLAVDLAHHEVAFTALRSFTSVKEKAVDSATRKQLSRAYAQLGELELSKGQRTVARRMFARAVETDPENKGAQRILTELNTLNAR